MKRFVAFIYYPSPDRIERNGINMKKFLPVIIAGVLLLSGCNDPKPESIPGTIPSLSERSSFQSTVSSAPAVYESKPQSATNTAQTVTSSETAISSDAIPASSSASEAQKSGEENELEITITINGREFSASLYDNETARAFKAMLPLTLDMSELNGNEKYYYLPDRLPTDPNRPSGINAGDIMLYGGNCVVLFYESFSTSYSYTPIGKVGDPNGLAAVLGGGNVKVIFS